MRVTESRMLDISSDAIAKARERSANATSAMSSGLSVTKPSDDLAKWTEAQRIDSRNAQSSQRGNAISTATTNLEATDGALASIGDSLNSARELATEAANGTMSDSQRAAAAVSINAIRDSIVGQANTRSTDGEYLLAGSQGGLVPFDSLGNYSGDGKARSVAVSETSTQAMQITGNVLTASSGVNVIGVLNTLSTALAANDTAGVSASLASLKTAVSQVATGRQQVGQAVSSLQQADDARASFEQQLATRKSSLVEVDAFAGATELASAKNQLDTATAVAAQVVAMTAPNRQ